MMLGNHFLFPFIYRKLKFIALILLILFSFTSNASAVELTTAEPVYELGQSLTILGTEFWNGEIVTLEIRYTDGTKYDTWQITTTTDGSFDSPWDVPIDYTLPDTLIVYSSGDLSGLNAVTTITASKKLLHQLQNGTTSSTPEWANGNINVTNSCYSEGNGVPYRYFVKDQESGDSHYFTINAQATKAYLHTFDYFTDYDISESTPISTIGGVCSPTSAAPPVDCASPTGTFAFPDPTINGNHISIPASLSDIVSGTFNIDGPRNLSFYNVVIDSVSKYFYTGTAADQDLNLTVYFTVINNGSVGFFWSGHLAEGTSDTWGIGNGSASVGGAPYHFSVKDFDGSGSGNQDRSVQGATICLPPVLTIECSSLDSICQNVIAVCSVAVGADSYNWTVTGGTIISGQGTERIEYSTSAAPGSLVEVSVEACNSSGCDDDHCCAIETVSIPVGECFPCVVTLTCPPDTTINCGESLDPNDLGWVTYTTTGDCPDLEIEYVDHEIFYKWPPVCPTIKTYARTWKVKDHFLNIYETCEQIIHIVDTIAPSFTGCPSDTTVECDAIPAVANVTASDLCFPPVVTFAETTTPGNCSSNYLITRTWTAVDTCGNTSICEQVITVVDTSPPVIADCPIDLTVECTNIPTAPVLTATDNCDAAPVVNFSETTTPGNCDGASTITRIWTATDECGNSSNCTQVITVVDTTPPVFVETCPEDITLECSATLPTPPTITAIDNCDTTTINVALIESSAPGPNPGETIITRIWVATDDCGNSVSCSQTINRTEDNTPPTFVEGCPADVTVDCSQIPGAVTLTADDNCDPNPVVDYSESTTPGNCVGNYIITRIWTATDISGNSVSCTQIVTVQDTTAPTITSCPTDITLQCDADIPDPDVNGVIATDCGNITVTVERTNNGGLGCVGNALIITDTYTVTDDCGNSSECSNTITVEDNISPVCDLPNDTTIVLCDSATICLPVGGTDNCSSEVTCELVSNEGAIINGEWCYLAANKSDVVTVQVRCLDECGNECLGSFTVTFEVNTKPIVDVVPLDPVTVCLVGDSICTQLIINDPGNGISITTTNGWVHLYDSTVCFSVDDTSGTYCNTVIVTDSCGLADTVSYCVEVSLCDELTLAPDNNIDIGKSCIIIVDEIVPLPEITGGCGPYTWKVNGTSFDPNTPILYNVAACTQINESWIFEVKDVCNRVATSTVSITGSVNCAPNVTLDAADSYTLCAPGEEICFSGTIHSTNGILENDIVTIEIISGPPSATAVFPNFCFYPDTSGAYEFLVLITDDCGSVLMLSDTINVEIIPPIIVPNASFEGFLCQPGWIAFPLPIPTQGIPSMWIYEEDLVAEDSIYVEAMVSGTYTFEFAVIDSCGNLDSSTVTIDITVNDKPIVIAGGSGYESFTACNFPETFCVPLEIENELGGLTVSSQIGTLNLVAGIVCIEVTEPGTYCDRIIAVDSCGAADTADYCIEVIFEGSCICPSVTIEKTHNSFQGQYQDVSIFVEDLLYEIGGFDFLIQYDASVLSFSSAAAGDMLSNCGWEYFTYRYGANGNCGNSGCPTGIIRLNAMAEINNGDVHPGCFSTSAGDLAVLTFLISNDRTYECQYVPMRFIWYDCGDNAFSDRSGDTLYIGKEVYDFNIEGPITNVGASFPSLLGPNTTCNIMLNDGKPDPIRCIDFFNGGIDIVCADSIDGRGDINLNEIDYEISDAVLFSNYFVYGLSVFDKNVEGQIAASDVNADGISLSVADLVYLIRVVVGDAQPFPKLTPTTTILRYGDGKFNVSDKVGAAYIVVSGNNTPDLLADNMEMKYNYDSEYDVTRILVHSFEPDQEFQGEFLATEGDIVSVEMASYFGTPIDAKLVPNQFALHQNYPNPFNPVTTISFELSKAAQFNIVIYNVTGQKVANFSGYNEAGQHEIVWDATDAASGVYFYKLQSGDFTDVKKMILLK